MATNFDKFLTPEAMLTPGVAGSMSMMMGNALHYHFNMPNGWSILILSFAFGLLVLANKKPFVTRSVLYVLNSLVIFCVAAGTVTLGANKDGSGGQTSSFSLVQSAHAQQTAAEVQAEYKKLSTQYDEVWTKISAAPKGANVSDLLGELQRIDRQRAALVRSIPTEAKTRPASDRSFFAPLKF